MQTKPFDIVPAIAAAALQGRPGLIWLDGDPHHASGRYSYLASDPVGVLRGSSLDSLDHALGQHEADEPNGHVPRFVGYLAYDHATAEEPAYWFGRYDAVLAHDSTTETSLLIGDDLPAIQRLENRLSEPAQALGPARIGEMTVTPRTSHESAIQRALDHITEGNIYQVNLARRWRAAFDGPALGLYLEMRQTSPVPLGVYLATDERVVLCRSMETFLCWDRVSRRLETRPIKGTVVRQVGRNMGAEQRELRLDPKEQAEHAMIVDLMRNDLGRIAETGSVKVDSQMRIEAFKQLHHMVSTVSATVRPGTTAGQILSSTFPPGSVTGAPKLRATEVIRELETARREVYTGAVGTVTRDGGMRFAVAIRTAQVRRGEVIYHAGGGIVEASQVAREVEETELKARVFTEAIAGLKSR